jgi:hypothetical protein
MSALMFALCYGLFAAIAMPALSLNANERVPFEENAFALVMVPLLVLIFGRYVIGTDGTSTVVQPRQLTANCTHILVFLLLLLHFTTTDYSTQHTRELFNAIPTTEQETV